MKTSLLTLAAIALVITGAVYGKGLVTPGWVAQETKKVMNQRLAVAHQTVRIASVHCLKEGASAFYCVGKLRNTNGTAGRNRVWNVKIDSNGSLHWHGLG